MESMKGKDILCQSDAALKSSFVIIRKKQK